MRPPTPPAARPGLPRAVVVAAGMAAAAVLVVVLRELSGIVGPAFLALVLTMGTQPLRAAAERRGLPGWAGSLAAILTIYAALIGLTVALIVAVARFATLLPSYEPQMNEISSRVVAWLDRQGVGDDQIDRMLASFDLDRVVALAGDLVSGAVNILSSLFFVITLVLFMVVDATPFSRRLQELPAAHDAWVQALTSFGSSVRRYLVVSTVFGLIVAVLDTVALMWLGVPVAVLWGLLAFITNYIPNIGFVIGVVPPAVIALLEGGPRLMVAVLVVYSVLNVVVQTIIQPKITGDVVGLSGTITMLSLVFWAYSLGAMGALLAVPLTLFVKAMLVDADPRAAWVGPLISGRQARRSQARRGQARGVTGGPPRRPGTKR